MGVAKLQMARRIFFEAPVPLGVDELQAGLDLLDCTSKEDFWDENIDAFRETVRTAIRETTEILETEDMPQRWRTQLERQVGVMRGYVDLADRYLAQRDVMARASRERLN